MFVYQRARGAGLFIMWRGSSRVGGLWCFREGACVQNYLVNEVGSRKLDVIGEMRYFLQGMYYSIVFPFFFFNQGKLILIASFRWF